MISRDIGGGKQGDNRRILSIKADGTYSYTPNDAKAKALVQGQQATDTFTYTAMDPEGETAKATLTFDITGQNDPAASDWRRLGVSLRRITVRGEYLRSEISHAHPSLDQGFHENEGGHRWTDGMALLPQALLSPFTGRLIVEVHSHQAALAYPLHPVVASKAASPNKVQPAVQAA